MSVCDVGRRESLVLLGERRPIISGVKYLTGSRMEKPEVATKVQNMARNASRCAVTWKIGRYIGVSRRRHGAIVGSIDVASNRRRVQTGNATPPADRLRSRRVCRS